MSSSSSTAAEDDAPELPGFYYDREKKKYFRLIPGHNNHKCILNKTKSEPSLHSIVFSESILHCVAMCVLFLQIYGTELCLMITFEKKNLWKVCMLSIITYDDSGNRITIMKVNILTGQSGCKGQGSEESE